MAPTRRSLFPSEGGSSSSSNTAAMLLLVMGYVFALSEKLQTEFKNLCSSGSSTNRSRSDAPPAASAALEPTRQRHDEGELHAPDPQGKGRHQKRTQQRHRASNRLEFLAAFLRKFSAPSSTSSTVSSTRTSARAQKQQQQQQQQQQQKSGAPVFSAPSTFSVNSPRAATRRGSGATAWARNAGARKVRLGSSIRSAPRVAEQRRGLLPAAAVASTSRVRRTDKTLCLDLDETLIHARGAVREMGENRFDFMLFLPHEQRLQQQQQQQQQRQRRLKGLAGAGRQQCRAAGGGRDGGGEDVDGNYQRIFVRKRPHLKEFLEAAAEMFEVVLFTAAPAGFAQAVVDQIDPGRRLVDHVLSRESCTRLKIDGSNSRGKEGRSDERGPTSVVKDLAVVGRPLSKVIMVDNSLDAIRYQLENGVHISSFYGDHEDTGLLSTLEALKTLAPMADVRDGIIRLSVETQARKEGHTLMPDGSLSPTS